MQTKLVNLVELAHVVEILDHFAARRVINDALRATGLDRSMLHSGRGFVSYAREAEIIEFVSRATGDRILGARVGAAFEYSAYGAYSSYVLGAPDLETALDRGRRALVLTHPGSEIVLRRTSSHLVVGRDSKGLTLIGHRHLDEGALFVIRSVARHFLGSAWFPDWVELPDTSDSRMAAIAALIGAPVRGGADVPGVAIRLSDLETRNPVFVKPTDQISLADLASLMGVEPAQTLEQTVMQVLRLRLPLGVASQEVVARHLAVGPRTLQRALRAEGTSYRRLRAQFMESHAKVLLCQTETPIGEVGKVLGFLEPKSFRRAFTAWTGVSPREFRATHAADSD